MKPNLIKNKTLVICLLGLCLLVGFAFLQASDNNNRLNESLYNDEIIDKIVLRGSGYWSSSFIHVDGNWSSTESTYDWCTGSGSWSDPYVIENVTIDGGGTGSCIHIENSPSDYFTIRNCTVFNTGGDYPDAGIFLNYTNNGFITLNNASNCYYGIFLLDSSNNTIHDNLCVNDEKYGLHLKDSSNNVVSKNEASQTGDAVYGYGIILGGTSLLKGSNYNFIYGNNASFNNGDGIAAFSYVKENILTENLLANNTEYGLNLWGADGNKVYKNYFAGNRIHARDSGNWDNNKWNSSTIGNYWSNYTGSDSDGDGIGDTSYTYFIGDSSEVDNLPIYGDPLHDGGSIHIDDSGASGIDWAWSSTRLWCNGSGTAANPYVIKDVTIDGQNSGSCILIGNSTVYFTLENCEIKNSGTTSTDSGIKLDLVTNGKITNNELTSCFYGMYLFSSNSCEITNNYIIYREECIIEDSNCVGNTISDNTCIRPVVWDQEPIDQDIEYTVSFQYDLNASSSVGIDDYEVNDTTNFAIDSNGILTNITNLAIGTYSLEVKANDTLGYFCEGVFDLIVHAIAAPTWDVTPTDQVVEFGDQFNYDVDASDISGIDHYWIDDTTNFSIDSAGSITNVTDLVIMEYSLEIRAYDPLSQYTSISIKVTVQDTTDPAWDIVPSDQIIEFGDSLSYDVDASDLSGIDHYWINDTTNFAIDANGLITNAVALAVGDYVIEIRAYDPSNNYCTATITITVEDTTDPTWDTTPTDQIIELGDSLSYDVDASDLAGIDHYWIDDTTNFAIDANGLITNIVALSVGDYIIEVRAYDPSNNYCTATITITVEDTTDPTWDVVPSDQLSEFGDPFSYDVDASDIAGIDHYWINDTTNFAIDANGVITNALALSIGDYIIEVRAYDPSNNYCTATITITVQDTTDPTWDTTPTDQVVEFGDSFSYDVDASDLSGIDYYWIDDTTNFAIDANGLITNSVALSVGDYVVEVRAYDPYGNYCTETITITVQDTTDPTWDTTPTDQVIELGDPLSYDVDASDLSGIDYYWIDDTTNFAIDANGLITNAVALSAGDYDIEVRAYDPYGNYCTETITITVQDTTDPTWDMTPTDQVIEFGDPLSYDVDASDLGGIDHYWLNDTTNFVVDANGLITNALALSVGDYVVEVRAYDPSNNYCTATITITVQDTTDPTWDTTPSDQVVEFGDPLSYDVDASDLSGIDHYWINDTVTFSIDGNGLITNNIALAIGEYWLEIEAYDPYGQYCAGIIRITVEDTTDPTWDTTPTDQVVEFGDSFSYDVDASDLSGIDYYWIDDTTNFAIDANGLITNSVALSIGDYDVEVRAYDPYGNYCTETITITVQDTTDPTWDVVPSDQTIEYGDSLSYDVDASDLSGIDHYWIDDTTNFAIDANGLITNIVILSLGDHWIEIRAYDPSNNYCTVTIRIIVEDTTDPTWDAVPMDQVVEFGDGLSYDVSASDLHGVSNYWLNDSTYFSINAGTGLITNNGALSVGIYYLEIRAYDSSGNYVTASIGITVEDTTPPSWSVTPTDQYVEYGDPVNYDIDATDLSGLGTWDLNDTTYFSIDSNGVITNSTFLSVGIYYLEVSVEDIYNNQRSTSIRIVVRDTDDPAWVHYPSDVTFELGTAYYFDCNATDLSGISRWELNDTTYFNIDSNGVITSSGIPPAGIHHLEVLAFDPYDQNCSAVFSITIEDTVDPVWNPTPSDQISEFGDPFNYDLDASDLAGISIWELNDTTYFEIDSTGEISNLMTVPVGDYWLEIVARDPSGNSCNATIKITVQDTTGPTWTFTPSDQVINMGTAFSYDLDATDLSGIDHCWINNTAYFSINVNGLIVNTTYVPVGVYSVEVRMYDPYDNYCTATFSITVRDTTPPGIPGYNIAIIIGIISLGIIIILRKKYKLKN